MAHTRLILGSIKFLQLMLSATCLGLHVYSFTHNLYDSHNTLFCGTFMGFTLISVALFLGYCIRAPAPKGVDFFFGFMGGVSFYTCGLLSLHYPLLDPALVALSVAEEGSYAPLRLSCSLAMVCFVTALVYVFEGCLLYDLWYYEASKSTVTFAGTIEDGKKYQKSDEELGPLDLTCCGFYLYDACCAKNERVERWKRKWRRRKKRPDADEAEVVVVVVEEAAPSTSSQKAKPPEAKRRPQVSAPEPSTSKLKKK